MVFIAINRLLVSLSVVAIIFNLKPSTSCAFGFDSDDAFENYERNGREPDGKPDDVDRYRKSDDVYSDRVAALEETVEQLMKASETLSRQLMLQQFNTEERTRTSGWSGVKAIRGGLAQGTHPYHSNSFSSDSIGRTTHR